MENKFIMARWITNYEEGYEEFDKTKETYFEDESKMDPWSLRASILLSIGTIEMKRNEPNKAEACTTRIFHCFDGFQIFQNCFVILFKIRSTLKLLSNESDFHFSSELREKETFIRFPINTLKSIVSCKLWMCQSYSEKHRMNNLCKYRLVYFSFQGWHMQFLFLLSSAPIYCSFTNLCRVLCER